MLLRSSAAMALLLVLVTSAAADEWVAVKLRGTVLQLVGQDWEPLRRGDIVSDERVIRTLENGRVEFHRDHEVIALGPQTQVQIFDKSGKRFTTVSEYFGDVTIEANVELVQHFAVQTPFMASVVKGTRFVVRSGKDWSSVLVKRGHVSVESRVTHATTQLSAGQSATATTTAELAVSGKGDLPPVLNSQGKVVGALLLQAAPATPSAQDAAALAKQLKAAAKLATGAEKKALEQAAKEAEAAAKQAEKADKAAAEAAKKAAEAEKKAAKEAAETDKKAAEAEKKASEAEKKATEKATKEAEKAAKEAAKEAAK